MMIAGEIQEEIAVWLRHLGSERRLSALTQEAYARDVRQFPGLPGRPLGRRTRALLAEGS